MKIHLVECEDWVRVYKDGDCVYENHTVSGTEILYALGIHYTINYIDTDLMVTTTADETAPKT